MGGRSLVLTFIIIARAVLIDELDDVDEPKTKGRTSVRVSRANTPGTTAKW